MAHRFNTTHRLCRCSDADHALLHACISLYADRLPLFHRLLNILGSVEAVWHVDRSVLSRLRVRHATIDALLARRASMKLEFYDAELREAEARGLYCMCVDDARYPAALRVIAQPPAALYWRGDARAWSSGMSTVTPECIAIVGTRQPSAYGAAIAYELSTRAVALGWCVVSGLALGIDSIAHEAAMKKTIAVLGGGIENTVIGPPRNQPLASRLLAAGGLCISEYPFQMSSHPRFFPERNRIIAGISQVTVVVEATTQSGSLITARHALEENRDVFAVPGEIFQPRAAGPNQLIMRGATPVTSIDHFAELLLERTKQPASFHTQPSANTHAAVIAHLSPVHQRILRKGLEHKTASASLTTIHARTKLSLEQLRTELVLLEIDGIVTREPTGEYRWV